MPALTPSFWCNHRAKTVATRALVRRAVRLAVAAFAVFGPIGGDFARQHQEIAQIVSVEDGVGQIRLDALLKRRRVALHNLLVAIEVQCDGRS